MANVHLVCEGKMDSLDRRLLVAVLVRKLNVSVQVTAAGGERDLGGVASWLDEISRQPQPNGSYSAPHDHAVAIEDRNFHPRTRAADAWNNSSGKRLVWHRHEIENYLLEPAVVHGAFASFRRTVSDPWVQNLPADEVGAAGLLETLAQPLLPHQAGGVLVEELRVQKGNVGGTDMGCRPRPPAGAAYAGRPEWIQALTTEIARLQQAFTDIAALPALQPPTIESRYDAIMAELQRPSFLQNREHLIDLPGKELLATLLQHLRNLGARRLSQAGLEDELLTSFEQTYRPGTLYQPDEFEMLAKRLTALAASHIP
ncbi:MAG TPA: hypothetical protein VMS17_11430 [Gemmataceae bacterium]|nr:hypothetical protein [Gemmataceae bacterium]